MQLTFDAHNIKGERDYNDRVSLAWYTAALGRSKKMPSLSKLQSAKANGRAAPPMDKQIQNLARWVQATGGKVIVRPRD